MHRTVFFVFALLLGACAPEVQEGYFACATSADCPDLWSCRSDQRCWSTPEADADGGRDAAIDASTSDAGTDACVPAPVALDLLVMIDKSGSMVEEQAALTAAFEPLIRALSTGDIDGDGTREFAPVDSLHVGVITSDLGALGNAVPTCSAGFGDDGLLVDRPIGGASGCAVSYPSFVDFTPGGSVSALADDFRCVATVGATGCGFEQQLEATLKAISPAGSGAVFYDGSLGHGDAENAGFLRDDSLLVTLLVTDEEDCSTLDAQLFDTVSGPYAATNLNLRCYVHTSALTLVQRYVDGLLALRSDPSRLVFAGFVGMPAELHGSSYPLILADSRMIYDIDTATNRVASACTSTSGNATPGRRFAEVAQRLDAAGAGTLVRSICQEDFSASVIALLGVIAPRLQGSCD